MLVTPALGFLDGPRPYPPVLRTDLVLLGDVFYGVPPVGDRPALLDHPAAEILPFNRTPGYGSAPPVDIRLSASHGPGAEEVTQGECRAVAASIRLPVHVAELPALRSIDPLQANARSVDLDGGPRRSPRHAPRSPLGWSGIGRSTAWCLVRPGATPPVPRRITSLGSCPTALPVSRRIRRRAPRASASPEADLTLAFNEASVAS